MVAASTNQGDVEADDFVVALSNASVPLLDALRIGLPVYPLKGCSLTLSICKHHYANTIALRELV